MKFRKKPVVIDAVQWTGENALEVLDFAIAHGARIQRSSMEGVPVFILRTIHGETALARPGDWIIPEPLEGRFYPCKSDVFAASYDPVGGASGGPSGCAWPSGDCARSRVNARAGS